MEEKFEQNDKQNISCTNVHERESPFLDKESGIKFEKCYKVYPVTCLLEKNLICPFWFV